jgi:adenylate cyclase
MTSGFLLALLLGSLIGLAALGLQVRRLRSEVEKHQTALARSVERLEHIERSFQRFAPLDIVEQIAQGSFAAEPSQRRVTVMFADIKGFTPLSERIEPAVMVGMLNGYFRAMNGALVAHHGHLARDGTASGALRGDGRTTGRPPTRSRRS